MFVEVVVYFSYWVLFPTLTEDARLRYFLAICSSPVHSLAATSSLRDSFGILLSPVSSSGLWEVSGQEASWEQRGDRRKYEQQYDGTRHAGSRVSG